MSASGSNVKLQKTLGTNLAARLVNVFTNPPLFDSMREIDERHPKQAEFIRANDKHLAMIGGIGSGKTRGGAMRAIRAAYGWIGQERIDTPNLGIVTAPTYPMLRDASLRTFYEVADRYIEGMNRATGEMRLKNGSEILWRSTSNPELLRGPSAAWWWGDEAAMYGKDVRNIMIGRLRQGGKMGHDWLTTTPKGRNWLWQVYVRDPRRGFKIIKVRSADNLFLEVEIVEEWQASYAGDFALQELEGEFIAHEGLIYQLFDRDRHTRVVMPVSFKRVIAGVDWGFAHPGVILVVGIDYDGRAYVLYEAYQRQRRIEEWASLAKDLRNTWNIETFYCDPSKPDYIKEFNKQAGVKALGADNTVETGIQKIQNRLVIQADNQPRLMVSREAANTIIEFEQYQWASNTSGIRDVPMKVNDHAMDALRYAIMGEDKPYGQVTSGVQNAW